MDDGASAVKLNLRSYSVATPSVTPVEDLLEKYSGESGICHSSATPAHVLLRPQDQSRSPLACNSAFLTQQKTIA